MSEQLERWSFFLLLAAITIAFGFLLSPFFTAGLWAVMFAIVFAPLSEWLTHAFAGRRLLAVSFTFVIVLLLTLVALFGLGELLASEAVDLYLWLAQSDSAAFVERVATNSWVEYGLAAVNLDGSTLQEQIISIGQSTSGWLADQALSLGSSAAALALNLVIMLYLLFVFLYKGQEISERALNALPLERTKAEFLVKRFVRALHALFRGTLIVAVVQGSVGGILFWIAGIPNPFLWSVVMSIAALVPAAGAVIVWLPAGLILLATGDLTGALIVLLGGAFIVGFLDNILRPILIGRDLEMSDSLIMLSIIGGLLVFGASGLIIGPVVSALFLAAWSLFEKEYRAN